MGMEVVNISLPGDEYGHYTSGSFGSIRVKSRITSVGCSEDGKESGSVLNLTDSPFFFGFRNSLVAIGCNSKASLTNIEPNKVGCELNCTTSKEKFPSKSIPFSTKPDVLATRCLILTLRFVQRTKGKKKEAVMATDVVVQVYPVMRLNRTSCRCNNITINGTNYAKCGCAEGYTCNPYRIGGCEDINDCLIRNPDGSRWHCRESDTCVNVPGSFYCVGDKTGAIMIGVGAGLGILVLVGGIWWLRKFFEKRKMQQQLHTREEEEGTNTADIADMWTIGATAPASSIVASSFSLEVEPLLPRPAW
ncbi:unnamed protein product [Arabidopsis arenosa]|uniref:Uncharacterized protein n=1 Tax=Arabidopsis arenosa TaxID=38785 RepID=A0A8S1ZH49_ARAAE|nr:unnamed protein product [Arabidopsis arenosa]